MNACSITPLDIGEQTGYCNGYYQRITKAELHVYENGDHRIKLVFEDGTVSEGKIIKIQPVNNPPHCIVTDGNFLESFEPIQIIWKTDQNTCNE
jgi:hypothetical protein